MTAATIPEMTRDAWGESITRLEIILADYAEAKAGVRTWPESDRRERRGLRGEYAIEKVFWEDVE